MKNSRRYKRWLIGTALPFLLFLLLFYGPISSFRVLWIQTAMHTSHCKFLAQWLYTDRYIQKVLQENQVVAEQKTEASLIQIEDPDEIIQLEELDGNYYRGYLMAVSDPSRISLVPAQTAEGELLEDITARTEAVGGINAGGYLSDRQQGLPDAFCVAGGFILRPVSDDHQLHVVGGMDRKNRLLVGMYSPQELEQMDYQWAVEFGPVLIVNGEKAKITGLAGGLAPRAAIGQTANGTILMVVIDGRQPKSVGATYLDLQRIFVEYSAINAIVLDGGSSCSMLYEGRIINSPSSGAEARRLPNAIVIQE